MSPARHGILENMAKTFKSRILFAPMVSMNYLTLALMTVALLAAAPAAEASCHACVVDATVEFADCTTSSDGATEAEGCGDEYVNSVLFPDH